MVDIILPVYKLNEQYFSELVDSLNNQTYTNYKLLIGGDDSNSINLCISILNKYPKISYATIINKGSKGIFENINNILKFSKSKYIQFLCQDDILKSEFLKENIDGINKSNRIGMSFCQVDWCDNKSIIFKHNAHKQISKNELVIKVRDSLWYFLNYGCIPGNLSPVMIKRDVINKIGYFKSSLKFASDFDYWIRLSNKFDILYLPKSNLVLRKHTLQASEKLSILQLINDRQFIYSDLLKKIKGRLNLFIVKLYLNQIIGSNHVYHLFKNKHFKYLLTKKSYPFNNFISCVFLILTLNGRLKYFSLKKII